MSPGKILQNYTKIYAILVLSGISNMIIFVQNLLVLVTATPKTFLIARCFTLRLQWCSCTKSFSKSSSIKFHNLKTSYL